MKLDRSAITGKDFARAADGYARDEVRRHLEEIASALEEPASRQPVGEEASEQLRPIIEGAEQTARALRDAAERECEELRASAARDVEKLRARAEQEAGARIEQARTAVKGLLERVESLGLGVEEAQRRVTDAGEEMARRLGTDAEPLVGALRERAGAIGAELDLMGSGLAGDLVDCARERAPEPAPPQHDERDARTGLAPDDLADAAEQLDAATAGEDVDGEGAEGEGDDGDHQSDGGAPRSGVERARLIALNMALSGRSRAETEDHLREECGIREPHSILEEVYARAEQVE
jgi:ElaB/YqjD/DUF883 family membrane-anchored ribosome-binding protein